MDENLVENSAKLGEYFVGRLREMKSDKIKEIRGRGLWIGLQLTAEAGGARKYCEALQAKGLLRGQTLGIDATTLEANAAMKSIVRKESGADWKEYLRTLAQAEGMEDPSEEDLRRMDRARKNKKVSNQDWHNPHDPDARIAKMKDGRTHLAYKAEHAVDLKSEAIVAAQVTHADRGDGATGVETLKVAQTNVLAADNNALVTELVADKGYHDNGLLAQCSDQAVRTYIPERKQKKRRWTDKPAHYERAFRANRKRVRGSKGKRLNRWRSERCERTFAHVCETGGGRRAWLRGLINVSKAHVLKCAAYNLGLLLRKAWGMCKPRNAGAVAALFLRLLEQFEKWLSVGMRLMIRKNQNRLNWLVTIPNLSGFVPTKTPPVF